MLVCVIGRLTNCLMYVYCNMQCACQLQSCGLNNYKTPNNSQTSEKSATQILSRKQSHISVATYSFCKRPNEEAWALASSKQLPSKFFSAKARHRPVIIKDEPIKKANFLILIREAMQKDAYWREFDGVVVIE